MQRQPTTTYPPLESVTQPTLPTAAAAHYLSRAAGTLRNWVASGNGPIQPTTVRGRHAWPVAEIKRLLCISEAPQ
jgi:hypothetical protein